MSDLAKHKRTSHKGLKYYMSAAKMQSSRLEPEKKQQIPAHMTQTEDRPHKCDQCEAAFTKKSVLKSHILTHSNEKTFKCNYCNYSSRQKSGLTVHIKKYHCFTEILPK